MKVTIKTKPLKEVLTLVSKIIQKRSPQPILQCLKFVAEKELSVYATNLEINYINTLACVEIIEPGAAVIPFVQLQGIVKESDVETITIETEKSNCIIKETGSKFKLFGLDPEDYPDFPGVSGSCLEVDLDVIKASINKTIFATAMAHSHYAISGVLWGCTDGVLTLSATDGHRLAVVNKEIEEGQDITDKIVPRDFLNLVLKLDAEKANLNFTDNAVFCTADGVIISSPLIEGTFPKCEGVIPKEFSSIVSFDPKEFEKSFKLASILVCEPKTVKFVFTKDKVVMSSTAPEQGESEIICPITMAGDDITICFNPDILKDGIKVLEKTGTLSMLAPDKPVMFSDSSEINYQFVAMPVNNV